MENFLSSVSNDVLSFTKFINLCFDKFGNKFKYIENTFIDENTEMTISFHNVEFQMKPKQHLKSETGFPNIINYDLFYVMVQDALGDEFKDYKFIKDSYKTYGIPMTILYKNVEYRRIPSRIVKYFSRNNTEYEEFKEIAAHYTNYEDMSADYPLIFPKIKERLWIELI